MGQRGDKSDDLERTSAGPNGPTTPYGTPDRANDSRL